MRDCCFFMLKHSMQAAVLTHSPFHRWATSRGVANYIINTYTITYRHNILHFYLRYTFVETGKVVKFYHSLFCFCITDMADRRAGDDDRKNKYEVVKLFFQPFVGEVREASQPPWAINAIWLLSGHRNKWQ